MAGAKIQEAKPDAVLQKLFLGGSPPSDLDERIQRGLHPRVEYRLLRDQYGMDVIGFDDIARCLKSAGYVRRNAGAWALRARPNFSFATLLPFRDARTQTAIVATGEDIGLPVALRLRFLKKRIASGIPQHPALCIITHGSYLNSPKFQWVARFLRPARHIHWLCLSESVRSLLVNEYGFSPSCVENAGYGVDTRFFSPQPDAVVRPCQVASAGMAHRDYKTLSAAVATKDMQDISVKIAADSAWYRSALDIDGETLPPNVEARSYGDYVGLRRLYAESAFVVVPLQEARHACGYAVIAEAMAMGKPVIATAIQARSDYIVDGETGFHVPPGDVSALCERIRFLSDRPELAKEMGQKARRHIEAHFTLEQYAARIAKSSGATE